MALVPQISFEKGSRGFKEVKINTRGKWEIGTLKWLSIAIVKLKEGEVIPSNAEVSGPSDCQWLLKQLRAIIHNQLALLHF